MIPTESKRYRATALEWRELRAEKLGPCRGGCGRRGTELHHLVGRDLGGDDVAANLVPLCTRCHRRYEDRAPGWKHLASQIGRSLTVAELAYVLAKKSARFVDRYLS